MLNNKKNKRESATKAFFWRFLERCGAQGVTFVVSIVLARLLDPSVYGTIALVTVFTTIVQAFVDSGLGTALVQKKDADDIDFSSVFYFNMLFCMLLYFLMFFLAIPIASFYDLPELIPLVRVLSITILISGIKNIQQAYVSRHMIFKKFFFATLAGTIIAAFVGIYMAYKGYGVWALVAQNLVNKSIDTIVLWFTVKWRPKRIFSFERLKLLWRFGWKLLATTLLDRLYRQLRSLIIGKKYLSTDLAYYNKGDQYPSLVVDNIDTSIDSVLLPSMSSVQDNKEALQELTRLALQVSSFLLMPVLAGLAVCANPLVRIMLTDKWLPCVPYLQVFCIYYAFRPLNTANLNAVKALGRSDMVLKLDIIKKCIGLLIIFLTVNIGVFAIAIGMAAQGLIAVMVNSIPNKKFLNYSLFDQMKDLLLPATMSIIMGIMVWSITLLGLSDVITLLIQVPLGIIIYIVLSIIIQPYGYIYIMKKAKIWLNRNK